MGWKEDIPEKAQEFLKEFSIAFMKSYPLAMVIRAQKNAADKVAAEEEDPRQLSYREWDSVEPDPSSLAKGVLYMRTGDGAAAWNAWKESFLVQTADNNILVFDSEKDYIKDASKPKLKIPFVGYTLVTACQEHFVEAARGEAAELEMSDPTISVSRYSWALDHSLRQKYMFQMHKGRNPACACFGGNAVEPEDAGAEFADQCDSWIETFKHCSNNAEGRDIEGDTICAAFERAKNCMKETIPELKDYDGDGTEGQMLGEMIYLAVVEGGCKEEVLAEVKKAPPMLRYALWSKTRTLVMTMVGKAVETGWNTIQKEAKKMNDQLEPKIMQGLEKIFELKEKIKSKALEAASEKLGELIEKHASPHMKPVFDALDNPLQENMKAAREVLQKQGKAESSVANPAERRRRMDLVPRNAEYTAEISATCAEIGSALQQMQEADADVFQDLDPDATKESAEQLTLEILDAGFLSLQEELDKPSASFDTAIVLILEKFDHDSVIQRATWMKTTVNGILGNLITRHVNEVMEPLIGELTNAIPEDLKELFDLQGEFNSIAVGFVEQLVGKFIDGAYPLPQSSQSAEAAGEEANLAEQGQAEDPAEE